MKPRPKKKTIIKAPFPTVEETAKAMGVSKKRLTWLIKLLEDVQKEFIDKKAKKSKRKPRK